MKAGSRILFIQHAGTIGGSVVSLKELIVDAIKSGYECTVICQNEVISKTYSGIGAATIVMPVVPFNHNTALFYKANPVDILRLLKVLIRTWFSFFRLSEIIDQVKPDLVHLNSSTLILYSWFLGRRKWPVILHIREVIVPGYFGWRKSIVRYLANKTASAVIYISEFEFNTLMTSKQKSHIIYNYVHEEEFVRQANVDVNFVTDSFTLITLGGLFSLKGGNKILEAVSGFDDVDLLVLGCDDPRIDNNELARIEGDTYVNEIIELLARNGPRVKFAGKVTDVGRFIAQSDCVIFWTMSPHFPRPVFESWLMRKPVIYFNRGFQNSLISSRTVFMIEGESVSEIREMITQVKARSEYKEDLSERTFNIARDCFTERNFSKVDHIYRQTTRR